VIQAVREETYGNKKRGSGFSYIAAGRDNELLTTALSKHIHTLNSLSQLVDSTKSTAHSAESGQISKYGHYIGYIALHRTSLRM
jgi:hypothetical protein